MDKRLVSHTARMMLSLGLFTGWQPSARSLWAQASLQDTAPAPERTPGKLKIEVLGTNQKLYARKRTANRLVVEVKDENNKPVAGATVTVVLPSVGPGGTFVNGSALSTLLTNAQGQAIIGGIQGNAVAGSVNLSVTAAFQGQTAATTATMTNVGVATGAGIGTAATTGIIAGIAAGAAVGIAAAAGAFNGTPKAKVSVSGSPQVGAPTVGGPR